MFYKTALKNFLKKPLKKFRKFILGDIERKIELIQLSLGRIELRQISNLEVNNLHDVEFKVFSNAGEDGIIQFLIQRIFIKNKIFIEFGVENYTESNTRFLLKNNNWSGLIIDGSIDNIEYIRRDSIYWQYNLKAEHAFITAENINSIIQKNGISGEIGLLSIDIDGNDFWVWKAIECIYPCIVICEYNSLFGPKAKVTIPYNPNFQRTKAHYSNLYFGASLAALEMLGKEKGYSLIGSNSIGSNGFFIRNDLLGYVRPLKPLTAEEAYVKSQFRQSRDRKGNLTFLSHEEGLKLIADMPVLDLERNRIFRISEIIGRTEDTRRYNHE
ncbi:MAG: hypothetical protein RMJ67_08475 [Elusimicrobiota bacterium]|nr:hypothetical protein [Endomicrobiia bacterium]MDW8166530.1 hypothetical protein [Elusimicrobiota bacterium]